MAPMTLLCPLQPPQPPCPLQPLQLPCPPQPPQSQPPLPATSEVPLTEIQSMLSQVLHQLDSLEEGHSALGPQQEAEAPNWAKQTWAPPFPPNPPSSSSTGHPLPTQPQPSSRAQEEWCMVSHKGKGKGKQVTPEKPSPTKPQANPTTFCTDITVQTVLSAFGEP
jgi:hypothetical protein